MPVAARSPRARTRTAILIVDQSPLVRGLVRSETRRPDCRVDLAVTPDQARALLGSRCYALVLCSRSMLGDLGQSLLADVTQTQPDAPCLFFSGALDMQQVYRLVAQNRAISTPRPSAGALAVGGLLGDTVRAMVAAIDARDPINALHSQRVTQLALQLGAALRLSSRQIRLLEMAALLHDIGKISVPQEILAKPGPLDEGEWSVMRQHAAYGAEIIAQVEELEEVARIVRHHHERVDGGGYPDRLAGEAIPELSRVICIADAYEAMTAHRVYRQAMPPELARAQLQAGLGSQFDARMGSAFLALDRLP